MPTVGELTPRMIGTQHVRINRHGTTIVGKLTSMRVTTEQPSRVGFRAPGNTYTTWVALTVGKTWIGDMRLDHPVSLLEEDKP